MDDEYDESFRTKLPEDLQRACCWALFDRRGNYRGKTASPWAALFYLKQGWRVKVDH